MSEEIRQWWRTIMMRRATMMRRASLVLVLCVATVVFPVPAHAADEPLGSLRSVAEQIGADAVWERGVTGAGVTVAIIDTGIVEVPAFDGRVVARVDLSAESAFPEVADVDTFGHGTHMAGIIAGLAPDADLVSIKVADRSGAVDVTQVIAAVDWVIAHAGEFGIDVVNLSYSSGSLLPYEIDPLTHAVERAWRAGIVVVVAAGNDGRGALELANPADDPYVVAVAGVEARATGTQVEYVVPSWATSGDGTRNPDVAAPGAHIDSVRAPGSTIDVEHPEGRVDETTFRGSGSSQAAAVVSAAATLLLDARPDLTPDQVKSLLRRETTPVVPNLERFSGAGVIRIDRLLDAPVDDAVQTWPTSDGSGSVVEAETADRWAVTATRLLIGRVTTLGSGWDGTRWSGTRWSAGEWSGTRWSAGEWSGTRWSGTRWSSALWGK